MSNAILFILKLYLHLVRKSKRYNANPVNLNRNAMAIFCFGAQLRISHAHRTQ
jgi:hypothetical protein